VRMTVNLSVEFADDDPMSYNTVAEIPGTDLKDEVVMLGAHLDSWHTATGATDNAAGVAVMMEAVRILKALNLQPRRTVRIVLWSGEEQGLLGSRAYVREHFGPVSGGDSSTVVNAITGTTPSPTTTPAPTPTPPPPVFKPEYDKLSVYYNSDSGTGAIRGIYLQGNEALRPIFRQWLQPFRSFKIGDKDYSASTVTISNAGGSDFLSFDAVGLPGFDFIQDDLEYSPRTWHSNQDTLDRIQVDDVKQSAIIVAAFVYNSAMTDQMLPRKPARRN
jgi:carboxypeptidase Q